MSGSNHRTFAVHGSAMHCMAWLGASGLGSAWQGMAPLGREVV